MLNFISSFISEDVKSLIFLVILILFTFVFIKYLQKISFYILYIILSVVTIPASIINEFTYRFFFDLFNIPTDNIDISQDLSKKISNVRALFYISLAPLILNSLLCIILTFPFSTALILGTHSTWYKTATISQNIMTIFGYLIGLYTIPDNNAMANLYKYCNSRLGRIFLMIIHFISETEEKSMFIPKLIFILFISFSPPYIIFKCLFKFLRLFIN